MPRGFIYNQIQSRNMVEPSMAPITVSCFIGLLVDAIATAALVEPSFRAQFILSNGRFCKLYSRCSCCIVHIVLFFCIISSSLSRRFLNQSLYHLSSQSHTSGLSIKKKHFKYYKFDNYGKLTF